MKCTGFGNLRLNQNTTDDAQHSKDSDPKTGCRYSPKYG